MGGVSSARNAGLDIALGDYVAFVDSDDWLDSDMYETLIGLAEKYDADIAEGSYRFHRPWKVENKVLDGYNTGEVRIYSNIEALNTLYFGPQMFGGLAIMVWTKIYRTSLLRNLRFVEGYIHEDVEFTPRAYYYANQVVKIEKSLYNYNIHLGTAQTSGMGVNLLKVKSGIYVRKCLLEFFSKNYVNTISKYQECSYYNTLIASYYECWNQKRKTGFKELGEDALKILMREKQRVLQMNLGWKNRLFYLWPSVYCLCVKLLRIIKRAKYKIHVFITGRN